MIDDDADVNGKLKCMIGNICTAATCSVATKKL